LALLTFLSPTHVSRLISATGVTRPFCGLTVGILRLPGVRHLLTGVLLFLLIPLLLTLAPFLFVPVLLTFRFFALVH
jgi:hypothetical protein